jgi:hypothetical protein
VSRSESFQSHAAASGPPPEMPKTAKRSSARAVSSWTRHRADRRACGRAESPRDPCRGGRWRSDGRLSPWRPRRRGVPRPRSWPAVEVEERPASEIAQFRIARSAAVSKSDRPVGAVLHGMKSRKASESAESAIQGLAMVYRRLLV